MRKLFTTNLRKEPVAVREFATKSSESTAYSTMAVFDGVEAHATVEEKAARFMYSLTSNHAFVDGNKRIGVLAMLMTLRFNGVELNYTQAELIDFGLSVAEWKDGLQ